MHIGAHHLHHHFVHQRVGSGIWFAGVLRFTAQSMLLVFLLIYLFDLGFSPTVILSYGVVFNLVTLFINHWVVGWLIAVFGPRKVIAISNVILILFAFGLYSLTLSLAHLYLLAAIQALAFESYFLSQHVYLAATAAAGKSGKKVGRQFSTEPVGYLLGPLIGGLIAWFWSPQLTNLAAGLILVASGLLAFISHDTSIRARHHYSHHKIWQIYRQLIRDWRNPVMVGGAISFDFVCQLWALYIGVFLLAAVESNSGYGILGLFTFAGSLFGILVANWVGKRADRGQERRLLRESVISQFVDGGSRMIVVLTTQVAGMIFYGLVSFLSWLPYEMRNISIYRRAYQKSAQFPDAKIEYLVCLENFGTVCRLLLFSLACLLSLFLSFKLTLIVSVASLFIINFIFLLPPSSSESKSSPAS